MARAKVLFTNEFIASPVIETDDIDLFERLQKASVRETPALAATRFVIISAIAKRPAVIHNAPEGRTWGGTLAMLQNEAFWPGAGGQSGVFLVYLASKQHLASVSYWGGSGFHDSPEFTAKIPQFLDLETEP